MAPVLAGAAHTSDPRPLPPDLVLLPRGVLQGVLDGSAVVHGRRAAKELLGRTLVPARHAERPSLHAVPVARRAGDPLVRRAQRIPVRRPRVRRYALRHRAWLAGADGQLP